MSFICYFAIGQLIDVFQMGVETTWTMVAKMDELGFGNCTNTRACEAVCPKCETIANIARLNREFIKAKLND